MRRLAFTQQNRTMKTNGNIDFERLEALVMARSWASLSATERKAIAPYLENEAAYNAMQQQLLQTQEAIGNDLPELEPDPAILKRLHNTLAVHPKASEPQKQSVFGSLLAAFSLQSVGVKTGIAACLLVAGLWFGQHEAGSFSSPGADSTAASISIDSSGVKAHDTTGLGIPMLWVHH